MMGQVMVDSLTEPHISPQQFTNKEVQDTQYPQSDSDLKGYELVRDRERREIRPLPGMDIQI